jgi:hypothetical protein
LFEYCVFVNLNYKKQIHFRCFFVYTQVQASIETVNTYYVFRKEYDKDITIPESELNKKYLYMECWCSKEDFKIKAIDQVL